MGGIAARAGVRDHGRRRRQLRLPRDPTSFVERLRDGYDLVQGCRLPSGGGSVMPGAMPLLHRWLGQPDVLRAGAGLVSARRSTTSTAGCAAFARTPTPTRSALHGDGVRDGDDHQVESLRGAHRRSRRSRSIPTGARPHPPHLQARFATAGERCASSSCTARAGSFWCPAILLVLLGLLGYALALPGVTIRRSDVRRAYAALREPC